MTVQDLVSAAMKRIGVLAAGETPQSEESTDGLLRLNSLIDSLSNERLTIYTITCTPWTIAGNDGSYTVGASANINTTRPQSALFIDRVSYIDTAQSPDFEYPLIMLTPNEYAAIGAKYQTNTTPYAWYYNPTYPTGTLTLWPVPTRNDLTGAFYAPTPVSQFASLATTISLPPSYERMLTANLAVELCPEYGQPVHPKLQQIADDSKAAIKIANYQPLKLQCDSALVGNGDRGAGWDINTGSWLP